MWKPSSKKDDTFSNVFKMMMMLVVDDDLSRSRESLSSTGENWVDGARGIASFELAVKAVGLQQL